MAAGWLAACDGSKYFKDLEDYVINLKHNVLASKKKKSTRVIATPSPELYRPNADHSPFQEKASSAKTGADGVATSPLNAYPLNVLRLIGTLVQDGHNWGIILAPDNKVYQVVVGDSIGDHYGKITKITDSKVEVMEPVVDNGKTTTQRIVTLQLKDQS